MEGTDHIFKRISQDIVDHLYEIFERVDKSLRAHNVTYSLIGGSLLGAVRHRGLIPWDDDGDIGVLSEDIPKLAAALEEIGADGRYNAYKELISYKIYPVDGSPVRGLENTRYPFVDIFTFDDLGDGILRPSAEQARRMFPSHFLLRSEWSSVRDVSFGPLKLMAITGQSASRYLTDAYGAGWEHSAYLTWNHEEWRWNDKIPVQLVTTSCAMPSPEK
ncbi:hypothetical protein CDO28_34465 (plasmid) [Sinorhizobium meliloti]|uniref:LicD family protein n=1 Tax=Rhizobium meliloti TaxID=382 RepID=UPI000B4A4C91|nr:LicD family protein [Sinorhizobium meliloti]ASP76476.1 hypothetical protein CDO28_34465 [Sinorhizobium meliloti]MDE3856965.1 LicD family protein [Sinorhizobium meliloti]MQW48029.1 hypothetical protein [Sinorhizobium meliloti]